MSLNEDFLHHLKNNFHGEVRDDLASRLLYSTDASIYQIEPLGVAFPKDGDDVAAAVEIAAQYKVPILPRGAGSSLAGQAIGAALILDLSRHMTRILSIDPESRTAVVEPGVVLARLEKALLPYGLQFGPDPASMERATVGGSLGNNATGAHSMLYGMAADNLLEADVVLADGSVVRLGEVDIRDRGSGTGNWGEEDTGRQGDGYTRSSDQGLGIGDWGDEDAGRQVDRYTRKNNEESSQRSQVGGRDLYQAFLQASLDIRGDFGDEIRARWPRTWRNASGYALNYLLPWSASKPQGWEEVFGEESPYPPVKEGTVNLAQLLAGSEGTLAIIRSAVLRLVPRAKRTVLGVLAFTDVQEAGDALLEVLEHSPSAVELVPQSLVDLARSVPLYASQISFLEGVLTQGRTTLLVVEFAGEDEKQLVGQAKALGKDVLIAESSSAQKQVWAVRKIGMGLVMSRPGPVRATAFLEDISVPADRLGEFVREMECILQEHKTHADFYGHASAGCLHMRPMMNLKTASGVAQMRSVAAETVELLKRLGGTVSGEHGDGIARGEWLEKLYGQEIIRAFRKLKEAADPDGVLNPGKIVDPPRMDQHLRYGEGYRASGWVPVLDFRRDGGVSGENGLLEAIEHCNGAGVCRKADGVMCPSFQATQDEMHSTRGRANLLRAMISGKFPTQAAAQDSVREALDLCLACKGCKAECPSAVDMAKLKYEFFHHYYQTHSRKLRDYLFGYIDIAARFGAPFRPISNAILTGKLFSWLGDRILGLAPERNFPQFSRVQLSKRISRMQKQDGARNGRSERVFFLNDAFSEYFHPEAGEAAVRILEKLGGQVIVLPVLSAGRTLISKGFLEAGKRHAEKLVKALETLDPEGKILIVGVEPSEIYTLIDEYPDLLPENNYASRLKERAWMIDEFLLRPGTDGNPRIQALLNGTLPGNGKQVLLHGHCYQKSRGPAMDGYPTGAAATAGLLKAVGYEVETIESTCCGMAGAFGYEKEHYSLSMQVGELGLLPQVRAAGKGVIVAAAGVSCKAQIEDGTGRGVVHPIELLLRSQ